MSQHITDKLSKRRLGWGPIKHTFQTLRLNAYNWYIRDQNDTQAIHTRTGPKR